MNQHNPTQDDGTRQIRIEGCEYRIPKTTLIEFLSLYGTVVSDIGEILFSGKTNPEDKNGGHNRTGNYIVKVRLERKIPELVPIMGKRVKFWYPGIQRLCSNCFGNHPKRVCHSQKIAWPI